MKQNNYEDYEEELIEELIVPLNKYKENYEKITRFI